MSTIERTRPDTIPGFSALKMKQELQERVYRNTEGMTDEEVREYIRNGGEQFYREMEERHAKRQGKYPSCMTINEN